MKGKCEINRTIFITTVTLKEFSLTTKELEPLEDITFLRTTPTRLDEINRFISKTYPGRSVLPIDIKTTSAQYGMTAETFVKNAAEVWNEKEVTENE